jgi:hypothetical protein
MRNDYAVAQHHATFMTTTTTELFVIERSDFFRFLKREPVISKILRMNIRECSIAPDVLLQQLVNANEWDKYKKRLVTSIVAGARFSLF